MIHDLAGLARENPDDLEIATIMAHLPKGPIPDLPTTSRDAIRLDDLELERQKELGGVRLYAPRGEEAPRRTRQIPTPHEERRELACHESA
jgi:hypothetical protein